MFCFLETGIREQRNMKIEYRQLWINTVNDLRYEIKFENRVKDKSFLLSKTFFFFFKQKYIFHSWMEYFCKIPKNLIASAFFLLKQVLKNIDIPWQKLWHLSTVEANFECCVGQINSLR